MNAYQLIGCWLALLQALGWAIVARPGGCVASLAAFMLAGLVGVFAAALAGEVLTRIEPPRSDVRRAAEFLAVVTLLGLLSVAPHWAERLVRGG